MEQQLGVYISVPFCRAKCTYCNFASGVFGEDRMDAYVDAVCAEISQAGLRAEKLGAELPRRVDSVYLGGGTPSLLDAAQVRRLVGALRAEFDIEQGAEITLECAPGQLEDSTLTALREAGLNRVSFGVQSFVDAEARAVGRLHTREVCLSAIAQVRAAGVEDFNVDLIAGLPGQTAASWRESVEAAIGTDAPHISVYMLEVDEDSRLGREVLATGGRYGAAAVPHDDAIAEWYGAACEWLADAGVRQYEISNFAREGHASLHNIKYWRREPYVGFGLDAHSMLRSGDDALRFANTTDLGEYLSGGEANVFAQIGKATAAERIARPQQFEEALFLGLRMNEGVSLAALRAEFGEALLASVRGTLEEVVDGKLMERAGDWVRLTARGRMASNEVFSRLLTVAV